METKKTYTVDEAKSKLEAYCAYQERCHEEVEKKLRNMGMIPQAAEVIIAHLIENNYLNEERFARAFARGKHRMKFWGRVRITHELKARGISKFNIAAALEEIDEEEYLELFDALAEKQWQTTPERNLLRKKKKITDFLLRKGFESNLVYDKITELSKI
ncbi:MAG: regulatory protein RecX [Flavobacterium sp.]